MEFRVIKRNGNAVVPDGMFKLCGIRNGANLAERHFRTASCTRIVTSCKTIYQRSREIAVFQRTPLFLTLKFLLPHQAHNAEQEFLLLIRECGSQMGNLA